MFRVIVHTPDAGFDYNISTFNRVEFSTKKQKPLLHCRVVCEGLTSKEVKTLQNTGVHPHFQQQMYQETIVNEVDQDLVNQDTQPTSFF